MSHMIPRRIVRDAGSSLMKNVVKPRVVPQGVDINRDSKKWFKRYGNLKFGRYETGILHDD